MKRETIDLSQERQIITNMIVSDDFLSRLSTILSPKFFKSSYAKRIVTWVLAFYDKYRAAPQKAIQDIYIEHRPSLQEEDAESIGAYLSKISEEYEAVSVLHNIDYLVQRAEEFINLRAVELLNEDLTKHVVSGNVLSAQEAIANYAKVARAQNSSVSVMNDDHAIFQAFNDEEEVLFKFSGDIGKVAAEQCRGDLALWMGAAKRGKSFALWWTSQEIASVGENVVFFSLEMRRPQVVRRGWQSLTGRPRHTQSIELPYFALDDENECYEVLHRTVHRPGVEEMDIKEAQRKMKLSVRGGDIRIICLPTNSATVADLQAHVRNLEFYENFVPSAIVIDYADLLITKGRETEERQRLNDIYLGLRGWAQRDNLYICSATQTNRGGFSVDPTAEHVGEDIRKTQHCSTLLALAQTKGEKQKGIIRVIPLLQRDGAGSSEQVVVLQSLACSQFCIDSRLAHEVRYDKKEK